MSELDKKISALKIKYLEECGSEGGTNEGFRQYARAEYAREPEWFASRVLDGVVSAVNRNWSARPRKRGDDLFSIAGYVVPETLTRPSVEGGEIDFDNERSFKKVHVRFATVQDLIDEGTIKTRKASQTKRAADELVSVGNEALRRAGGNRAALLKDVADRSDTLENLNLKPVDEKSEV